MDPSGFGAGSVSQQPAGPGTSGSQSTGSSAGGGQSGGASQQSAQQSGSAATQQASIDAYVGDTIEIKIKLKYRKADVQKLQDKDNYQYIAVFGKLDVNGRQGDEINADPEEKLRPATAPLAMGAHKVAKVSQDDQDMTFYLAIPQSLSKETGTMKCAVEYLYQGDPDSGTNRGVTTYGISGASGKLGTINIKPKPQQGSAGSQGSGQMPGSSQGAVQSAAP